MAKMTKVALALITTLASSQALAWGQTGHRVTGELAERYLSQDAKAAIESLIGHESLAQASTWPDEMRSHPSEFWQKIAWRFHFTTIPDGKTYLEVEHPKGGDAYIALNMFRAQVLDGELSLQQRQLALRFIVHLIGDLHQPLHVGNGTDRGGNDVKVEFFREESNLHRVWDSGMIDKERLSFTEWTNWLGKDISEQDVKDWQQTDPLVWMQESQDLRMGIYPDDGVTELSSTYKFQHIPTVKHRLKQGGVRIAHYLNEMFATD